MVAIRENVIRVEFESPIFLSGLLEPQDAARVEKWSISADESTTGLDDSTARQVRIVRVELTGSDDGVVLSDSGRFVNLILDRPMTPFPAVYGVSWSDIFSRDLTETLSGGATLFSTYRRIEPPTTEAPRKSGDFANPQTVSAARESFANPLGDFVLGTYGVGDDGDYALDAGNVALKKRAFRVLMTRKNGFAHLPGYGVGIPEAAMKLGTPVTITSLRADAEEQLSKDPDVAKARVVIVQSLDQPDLVRFRVALRPKVGKPFAFDVPIRTRS